MSPVLWGGGTFAGGEASEAESQCMWTTTTTDAQLDCCVGVGECSAEDACILYSSCLQTG